mmetsp:Transcript_1065/g.1355  ORF Transcript_1065/g.1355 Transcript_1065/m.1355 type:complete len:839 (-) Transcript_1065:136-2652(-)
MASETQIRRLIVDLKRLLYRMENYNPDELSSYTLRGRAALANEILAKLQELEYSGACELREQVKAQSLKAESLASQKQETEPGLIDQIFLEPKTRGEPKRDYNELLDVGEEPLDETLGSNDDNSAIQQEAEECQSKNYESCQIRDEDVEEIKKAQREQLEAEISHMVSQLKSSTQHMNTTLRGQTENLQEMEDLAAENINKVGKAAENVKEHNKRAWSSTIATWTWFMVVIGLFIFCMITIKMVPRRANACLFRCKDPVTMEKRAVKRVEELKAEQRDLESNNKKLEEKYVAQGDKDQLQNQCESEVEVGRTGQCNVYQSDNAGDSHQTQNLKSGDDEVNKASNRKNKKPKQPMLLNPHRRREMAKPKQSMSQNESNNEKVKEKKHRTMLLNPHRQRRYSTDEKKQKQMMQLNPHRQRHYRAEEKKQQQMMLLNPHRQRSHNTDQKRQQMLMNIHGGGKQLDAEIADEEIKTDLVIDLPEKGQQQRGGRGVKEDLTENIEIPSREDHTHNENMKKNGYSQQNFYEGETHTGAKKEKDSVKSQLENTNIIKERKSQLEKQSENEPHVGSENAGLHVEQTVVDSENTGQNAGSKAENLPNKDEISIEGSLDGRDCESGECSADSFPEIKVDAMDVHAAAAKGDVERLQYYLQQAPSLATNEDERGWQPLHEAVFHKQQNTIDYLLQLPNVDVNSKTKVGETAVWLSRGLQPDHPIMVSLKLAGGVSIGPEGSALTSNVVDFEKLDILHAAQNGNNKLLSEYLEVKPEWVNFADRNGWTAIHEAIRAQHTSTVITILEQGGDANAVTNSGSSPLAMAIDYCGENHAITEQLRKFEAIEIRP